jgi:hypothetical protein
MQETEKSEQPRSEKDARSASKNFSKQRMPVKQQRSKSKSLNVNRSPHPTDDEMREHVIVRNGIELSLSPDSQDPNVVLAKELHQKYPGHLVLIQAGDFLHAYNKCAHFLHRLKGYKMKLMGSGSGAYLRVGFPLSNSKRRIWKIMSEFKCLICLCSAAGRRGTRPICRTEISI